MDRAPLPATREADSACVLCLRAVTGEIRTAMDAIASNDLARLTESVALQEVLGSELVDLYRRAGPATVPVQGRTQVAAAEKELQRVILGYAALLRHSGKTVAMLALLCNSYTGTIEEARSIRSGQQTWFCEM